MLTDNGMIPVGLRAFAEFCRMLSLEASNVLFGRLDDFESLLQSILKGNPATHSRTRESCHFLTPAKESSNLIDGFINAKG
jgi:hypothetical protein